MPLFLNLLSLQRTIYFAEQNLSGKMFGEINNSPHCESCLNKAPPPPAATAQKGGCPGCGQPCTSGSVLTWNEVFNKCFVAIIR